MRELLAKMVSLGLGIAVVSKEQMEKLADELVKRGEMAPGEARKIVDEMVEKGREEKKHLSGVIKKQVKKTLAEWELVTKEDIAALEHRVLFLEERLLELEGKQGFEGSHY